MSRNEDFAAGQPDPGLSADQRKILDFAGRSYNNRGEQEEAILTEFGYRGTTFFRRLNDLLTNPAAAEYAPETVRRHQEVVDAGLTKWGRKPRYAE